MNNRVPIEIVSGEHPWCEITLADGNRLRLQIMVAAVYRNDSTFDANGMPEYQFELQTICKAFPPRSAFPLSS